VSPRNRTPNFEAIPAIEGSCSSTPSKRWAERSEGDDRFGIGGRSLVGRPILGLRSQTRTPGSRPSGVAARGVSRRRAGKLRASTPPSRRRPPKEVRTKQKIHLSRSEVPRMASRGRAHARGHVAHEFGASRPGSDVEKGGLARSFDHRPRAACPPPHFPSPRPIARALSGRGHGQDLTQGRSDEGGRDGAIPSDRLRRRAISPKLTQPGLDNPLDRAGIEPRQHLQSMRFSSATRQKISHIVARPRRKIGRRSAKKAPIDLILR
jgi:hypothetical protein